MTRRILLPALIVLAALTLVACADETDTLSPQLQTPRSSPTSSRRR